MLIERKRTADLIPADYNPRKDLKPGDPEYDKLKRSMEQFGYVEPVIWNKTTGRMVGGHQRLKVLMDMGVTEVECVVVELDEEREKALNIALNKISGDWDKDKLMLLISDLQGADFDVSLTGFDPAEIDDLFKGFTAEPQEVEASEDEEPSPAEVDGLCISMPASLFSETALQNLKDITAAKGSLIRKALGVEELPIEVGETKVSFPWFAGTPTPEEVKAYDHFICALCEMARNQKRITAKERDTGNDKYAFRCFLLRLGFIGPEYKQERKILLRNLTGSSAFRAVPQKEVADDEASE